MAKKSRVRDWPHFKRFESKTYSLAVLADLKSVAQHDARLLRHDYAKCKVVKLGTKTWGVYCLRH